MLATGAGQPESLANRSALNMNFELVATAGGGSARTGIAWGCAAVATMPLFVDAGAGLATVVVTGATKGAGGAVATIAADSGVAEAAFVGGAYRPGTGGHFRSTCICWSLMYLA